MHSCRFDLEKSLNLKKNHWAWIWRTVTASDAGTSRWCGSCRLSLWGFLLMHTRVSHSWWLRYLGPWHPVWDQNWLPGSCLWVCPALAAVGMWGEWTSKWKISLNFLFESVAWANRLPWRHREQQGKHGGSAQSERQEEASLTLDTGITGSWVFTWHWISDRLFRIRSGVSGIQTGAHMGCRCCRLSLHALALGLVSNNRISNCLWRVKWCQKKETKINLHMKY